MWEFSPQYGRTFEIEGFANNGENFEIQHSNDVEWVTPLSPDPIDGSGEPTHGPYAPAAIVTLSTAQVLSIVAYVEGPLIRSTEYRGNS